MGWAYGIGEGGREIGYGVEATCDEPGCQAKIDRGIDYACGGMHGRDDPDMSCAGYFCYEHQKSCWDSKSRCRACADAFNAARPGCVYCWEVAAVGVDEDGQRTCGAPSCSEPLRQG